MLIAPSNQIAARAELQLLKRRPLHTYLDRFHFNSAFWTRVVAGINGRMCEIAIV